MLSSLADMETRLAALHMQTKIHCSSGTRSALETLLVALHLCVVALQLFFLCPSAPCSYPLFVTLSSGHALCGPASMAMF